MKPAPVNPFFEKTNNPPRVSHISVYPRNLPFKEWEFWKNENPIEQRNKKYAIESNHSTYEERNFN